MFRNGSIFLAQLINYDTLVEKSFEKYLEQYYINQNIKNLNHLKYSNIKMIVPSKNIIVTN